MTIASKYPATVRDAFDTLAPTYDAADEASTAARANRELVYSIVRSLVPPPALLLDINCGTGTDALALAAYGYRVHGVDVSPRMIAEARKKSEGRADISFDVGEFEDLHSYSTKDFDLVLSNLGGLNCANDLRDVGAQVADCLKPGGFFVAVVMTQFSLWEFLGFAARGRWQEAVRRFTTDGVDAIINGHAVRVRYFSKGNLMAALESWFRLRAVVGLNVVSPPPQSIGFTTRNPRLTTFLHDIDSRVRRMPVIRWFGDHTLLILQRTDS